MEIHDWVTRSTSSTAHQRITCTFWSDEFKQGCNYALLIQNGDNSYILMHKHDEIRTEKNHYKENSQS